MPIIEGVGFSEHTKEKYRVLSGITGMHLKMTKGIIHRWRGIDPYYYYVDLNAGPGRYSNGNGYIYEGSPVLFRKVARIEDINYRAFYIEIQEAHCNHLREVLGECPEGSYEKVICGDNTKETTGLLDNSREKKYGLIFSDPTGSVPPFDMLAKLSKLPEYRCIDFMIYLTAASYKRILKASHCDLEYSIIEQLSRIRKSNWVIREPVGKHQFTFLIGSNWKKFPGWKNQRLYRLDSSEGQECMKKINYTKAEQSRGQLELF